jgi:RNA polymerase sigma-70 factor (ECF subfamily)
MKWSTKSSMGTRLKTKPGTGTIAGRPPTGPVRLVTDTAGTGTATAVRTAKDRRRPGPVANAPRRDRAAPLSAAGAVDTLRPTALLVWGGRPATTRVDEATFKRAQGGDPAALNALYRAFAPAVVQYLRVRGIDDPDGGCHDVFLSVIPRIRKAKGGIQGFRVQLFNAAHARMVDHFRHKSMSPATDGDLPDVDNRTVPPAGGTAVATLTGSRVETLLQVLGSDQREVVLLRIVAGLSIEETAAVMKQTPGAVKQLQRHGLRALRGLLETAEGEVL